jgi:hypothetical protein
VKCLYVKTSDSDVSSETIEDWKWFKREPIEFIVFESEENVAVLDFIRMKILTCWRYWPIKEGFGLFQPSYTKKEHPEFHIPILAIHID